MIEKIISFRAKDNIILNGVLFQNENKSDKVLIQVHGMTSDCFKERNRAISKEVEKIGVDTLDFNNRGSDIIKYISDGENKKLAGTAYEDIEDCYYDIVGAVEYALGIGYKDIYLQGHSLGCTKIVYTHDKLVQENSDLLNKIKGIILLSLVDIPGTSSFGTSEKYTKYAEEKEKNGEIMEMMPLKSYIHPMSVKNYLKYNKYNKNIDFAPYDDLDNDFKVLNSIKCPLFMRWGNVNELIKQDAKELSNLLNKKIENKYKDISYIDGADHGYHGKEEQLSQEIRRFIERNKK